MTKASDNSSEFNTGNHKINSIEQKWILSNCILFLNILTLSSKNTQMVQFELPYAVWNFSIWENVEHFVWNRNIVEMSILLIDEVNIRYPDFLKGFPVKFKYGDSTTVVSKAGISPSLTQKKVHRKVLKCKRRNLSGILNISKLTCIWQLIYETGKEY